MTLRIFITVWIALTDVIACKNGEKNVSAIQFHWYKWFNVPVLNLGLTYSHWDFLSVDTVAQNNQVFSY